MVDGHLNFDTRINEKGFTGGLKSLGKSLDGIKSKVLGVGAAIGLAFSGKELVQAAASMKASKSQFEQTFGVLQEGAEKAIGKVAAESGILKKRLQGTATSIYAFAKTTGMQSTQALDMMSEALQVAADSAAYYDKSLEETSETLKSYLKGNFANDAALGLSSTEFTRNAKALELYGKKYTELSEAQKQLTLLQMVKDANKLSGAEGQAAREAEGWENVIGNLKQAWTDLMAALGTPVLSVAVKAVKRITEALQRLTEAAGTASAVIMEMFGLTDSTASSTASVAADASDAAESYSDMADSAAAAQKANDKSLASFDKINKLGSDEDTSADTAGTPATAAQELEFNVDTAKAEKSVSEFEKKLRRVFDRIKGYAGELKSYYDRNFSGIFDNIFTKLAEEGGEFRGTLEKVFYDVGTLAAPMRDYLTNDFTPYLQQVMTTCGDIAGGLFDSFNRVFSDIWNVAVFPILQSFITDGLPLITQFRTEVWTTLDALFNDIKILFDTWWADFGVPIFAELATIWTDTVTILKQKWDEYGVPIFTALREALDNTKDTIVLYWNKWLKPVFDYAMQKADEVWKKHLAPLLDNILGLIGDLIKGTLEIYNKVITPVVKWILEKLAPVFETFMKGVIEYVSVVFGDIIDVLNKIITFFRDVFNGNMSKAWEDLKGIYSGVGKFFYDTFNEAYNFIVKIFEPIGIWAKGCWDAVVNAYDGAAAWFGSTFDKAYWKLTGAFSGIKKWAADRWDEVKKPFESIADWFGNKFDAAWSAIKNAFSLDNVYSFFRGVKDAITGIFEGVVEGIKSPFNSAIQGINWVIDQLNSMSVTIPFYGGETTWSWSIPKLPYLAQGMAVPANYGEFLAVLGDNKREPEVVSPVSTMEAAMRKVLGEFGGMGGGDITLIAELDGDVIYRKVVERNKQHVDATGTNEFIY